MNKKKFSDAMTAIDDKYIDEALAEQPQPKKHRNRLAAALAAACLIMAVGGFHLWQMSEEEAPTTIITHYSSPYGDAEMETSSQWTNTSTCYAIPNPGKVSFETDVTATRNGYSQEDVRYMLQFEVFDVNHKRISDDALCAEYERLAKNGIALYTVSNWHYEGEGKKVPTRLVVGCFTEEELVNFPVNPAYGYFFSFPSDGDSNPLNPNTREPLDCDD